MQHPSPYTGGGAAPPGRALMTRHSLPSPQSEARLYDPARRRASRLRRLGLTPSVAAVVAELAFAGGAQ